MSLDINLNVSVYHGNITHNLGKMAGEVPVGTTKAYLGQKVYDKELTLYDVLWRPEEQFMSTASDVLPYLEKGYMELLNKPEHYKTFSPENGWGTYDGLIKLLNNYITACKITPDAYIEADR